ncbi:MAG: glycosyltransferase [Candidatus Acidiferrales bacterium]
MSDFSQPNPHREAKRILMFIQSLELGGSEKQCVEMARLLSRNGFLVTVGCMRRTGPLRRKVAEAGLQLVEFPVGSLLRPKALLQMLRLARFIRVNRFDVVHANDLYANLFAVPAAKWAGVRIIVSSQRDMSDSAWYTSARKKVLRGIQRMSTYVLVNSAAIRSQLMKDGGFESDKVCVVYNGIDVVRYSPDERQADTTELRPFLPDAKLIVMVANMHRDVKGHGELLMAAQKVCREYPRARFLLVGDGEMRGAFEMQARSAGLENSIIFLGHRTDVAEILKHCHIGVLASRAEGMPNAVMEYMASGLATVATSVGGVPEIVDNEVNGLLVPPRNPVALSEAILRILNDEDLRCRLGKAGRETIQLKCGFASLLRNLRNLYQGPSVALPAQPSRQTIAAD